VKVATTWLVKAVPSTALTAMGVALTAGSATAT
jgi:hypothetical protein